MYSERPTCHAHVLASKAHATATAAGNYMSVR